MIHDILIVDDEAGIRAQVRGVLEDEGYAVREAVDAEQAYEAVVERLPSLVVLDIWLEGSTEDGLAILKNLKKDYPDLQILMISGHGNIETAVDAIKHGAYDFIEKPFKADRLLLMVRRALENAALLYENRQLKEKADGPSELIGDSPAMAALQQVLPRVARTNSRVLITGEPGTGKEVAARALHRLSARSEEPFLTLNCAVMRPEDLELRLFGNKMQQGILEQAHGGTLLLDEVADMPSETQGKIVRILQEQKFQRVGESEYIEVDVRIIATTNRDLQALMDAGRFRQDLYYRLNVVPLDMPPLRERTEDISVLAEYFAGRQAESAGLSRCSFAPGTLVAMQSYDWPGNVRQLRNVIEWLMIMNGSENASSIMPDQLPSAICGTDGTKDSKDTAMPFDLMGLSLREARERFERTYLNAQIKRFGGNVSRTASFIGMERSALHRKLKQLGLPEEEEREDAARRVG